MSRPVGTGETGEAVGAVVRLWTKRCKGGPMDPQETVTLVAGEGIVGDANHRGRRQVTLIAEEAWREIAQELGPGADPALRRANVLVRGLDLERSRGRILRLGPARLEVHGEVRPCRKMEESLPGLQKALDPHWRGGVYATVLEGGKVAVGDGVGWE
jgi:MOSC domain-containing protein YiiM